MKTYNLIDLLALLVLAACGPVPTPIVTLTALQPSTALPNLTWTALPPLTPITDLSYDPDPSTVILNADVLPREATCRRAMVAGLRLWGDGLLYVNDPWYHLCWLLASSGGSSAKSPKRSCGEARSIRALP
jgi:hypothetical protein